MSNNNIEMEQTEVSREMETALEIALYWSSLGKSGDDAPGYFVQTFGCQQNEADSEKLAGLAETMGYRHLESPDDAQLILVNTCAIREHAELKALSVIGQYKHIKEKNPELIIGVGGCMTAQEHRSEKLKDSFPYVSFVFDTSSLHRLPSLVKKSIDGNGRSFIHGDDYRVREGLPSKRMSKHSAWLSVMYGCNNFCSYCIVPYVRGRERSRRPCDIIEEARQLISDGAREITLLGQNVNSYGLDLGGDTNIADLMRSICSIEGDFRLRFMTSHPKDASDELISAIAEEDKIVSHFHLPVQSGSDNILKRMNRKYTAEHYLEIIEKLKRKVPDITITTDIIVGFPGETDEDFEKTMDLLRSVRYDMIFSFIYSPRVGTPAANMRPAVPHEVSAERFERMQKLQNEISLERNQRFVGRKLKVLVDEVSRKNLAMLTGRGVPARPVHFEADRSLIGSFAEVEIKSAGLFSIEGVLI